ncbi:MAG TPA: Spy/CpxP family protein refolding chaperone [Xanthobacteraceae bacterium]|jgi:hypothetical protein
MKKKTLLLAAIATTAVVVSGWAMAQSMGPSTRNFGPHSTEAEGPDAMGPGAMGRHMGRMGSGMGPGMMHQKGPGMGHQKGPGMGHRMTQQDGPSFTFDDPTQIEGLKRELGITTAQEPAWNKYTKAIQDARTTMKTTREGVDPNTVSKMTPQDRYAFVTKMREQGQKQFDTVKTAADELLATLDDTQKAKARDTLPGLASFGPGPMRGAFLRGQQHEHQDH